jgi:hypothetical protein
MMTKTDCVEFQCSERERIKEIHSDVKDLTKSVVLLAQGFEAHSVGLETINARLQDGDRVMKSLDEAIRGNGKEGLNTRMAKAEIGIVGLRKWKWWLVGSIGSLGTGLLLLFAKMVIEKLLA